MKEIKLIHIITVVIFVLALVAIAQWAKLPRSVPAPTTAPPTETGQLGDLAPLQEDIQRLNAPPPLPRKLPSPKESFEQENHGPKKPSTGKKAEL